MKRPEIPVDEKNRITSLCNLKILDTPPEERFDRITRIAQKHFKIKISLVSLVDSERQWFKSRQGLDATETPRDISFCGHAVLNNDIFYIPNALEDPRFEDNPLVTGGPNIRFYAGAPLHSQDGSRIGTLCVIDDKPHDLSEDDFVALRDLADCVEEEIKRTHLLKMAEEYKEQRARLEYLLRANPGVIYTCEVSDDYGVTFISDNVIQMLGYKPEQFIDEPGFWLSHIHPEDVDSTIENMKALFETGSHIHEYRFRHADGFYHWMYDKLHVEYDDEGNPEEIVGLWMDIDTRKKAEQMSRESETRIRAIVDNVVDGIITIDSKGIVETFNSSAENLFGYDAAGVIGQNVKMLMPEPYHNEHDTYLRNYFDSGQAKIIGIGREVTGRRKGGSTFPMELAVSEMQVDEQRMFTGIVRDITDRKQAEQDVRDRESRIQAIVDTVVDGIVTINEKGIVETFNPAAEKLFGYAHEEVIGHNVNILMPGPYTDEHDSYLDNYLKSGEARVIGIGREVVGKRKNGSTFPMELAVSEMQVGEQRMFTGIVRNITERKKIDRLKNEFVSTVSHELRTPLTSIRGALSLVLGKSADGFSDKTRHMLEVADRNSERLTLLINDILDLEKIESGSLDFELKAEDLISLAQSAVEANEGYARQHGVKLQYESAIDKAVVKVDSHRLLQVFANLISNAVKFSRQNDIVEIGIKNSNGGYRVSVQDYGRGIPEKFQAKIFQRFSQVDSSDSREKGGTGLGLSITKAIVEHHNGSINFESEQDKGTIFYFDIPAYIDSESYTKTTSKTPNEKVLICEDDEDVAHVFTALLKEEGLQSDIAKSAQRCKELLTENKYRLLLLDLTLPDKHGLVLLRELRENEITKCLPIIVVSGHAEKGRTQFNGDAVTVVDWLQKPVDQNRFSEALKQALHSGVNPKVLHVEDDPDVVQVAHALLEDIADFEAVSTLNQARQKIKDNFYNLIILDVTLPDGSGLDLFKEINGSCSVVVFSGQDLTSEITNQVAAALTKSKTTNEELLATIKTVLARL